MTRKDYILLADALRKSRTTSISPGSDMAYAQWKQDVVAITYALEIDNPRFNPLKFAARVYLDK